MSFVNTKLKEFNNELKNKKIAIIGLGVSNSPLIDYMQNLGTKIEVFDESGNKQIKMVFDSIDTKATFNRFDYFFSEAIKSVDYAMNTIVIKCHTGMAQVACEVFDNVHWDGVVGTLAGENTIFVLTRNEKIAGQLCEKIRTYIK